MSSLAIPPWRSIIRFGPHTQPPQPAAPLQRFPLPSPQHLISRTLTSLGLPHIPTIADLRAKIGDLAQLNELSDAPNPDRGLWGTTTDMIYEVEAQELKRKIRDTEWQIVLLRREIREEEEMRKEDLRRRVAISTDIARLVSWTIPEAELIFVDCEQNGGSWFVVEVGILKAEGEKEKMYQQQVLTSGGITGALGKIRKQLMTDSRILNEMEKAGVRPAEPNL